MKSKEQRADHVRRQVKARRLYKNDADYRRKYDALKLQLVFIDQELRALRHDIDVARDLYASTTKAIVLQQASQWLGQAVPREHELWRERLHYEKQIALLRTQYGLS